jgi:hypothetical protein
MSADVDKKMVDFGGEVQNRLANKTSWHKSAGGKSLDDGRHFFQSRRHSEAQNVGYMHLFNCSFALRTQCRTNFLYLRPACFRVLIDVRDSTAAKQLLF